MVPPHEFYLKLWGFVNVYFEVNCELSKYLEWVKKAGVYSTRGCFQTKGNVDDYLKTCEKLNPSPPKAYSGNLMLRIPLEN